MLLELVINRGNMKKIHALILIVLTGCGSDNSSKQFTPPVVPVLVAEAKVQDVPLYFESLGTLKPSVLVEVRPQVSGMLKEVHFSEGQTVKKGDPLFSIDSSDYSIALQEAEAQLAQDQATLDSIRRKSDRFRSLSKKDLIPQQEWDEIQSEVARQEALLMRDQARVAAAKLNLERCKLISPIEGRAGKVHIHSGNLVSQPVTLVTVSDVDDLIVDFTLTEREFQQLTPEHQQGQYPIEIASYSSDKANAVKGTLKFLDTTFDVDTGLLHLQGAFSNDDLVFLPGQHVHVRVPVLVKKDLVVVPQKAIKINQLGPYVFVVKADNTVELRPVRLAEEVQDLVVVVEGLSISEKVVTEGHLRLSPGLAVKIQNAE